MEITLNKLFIRAVMIHTLVYVMMHLYKYTDENISAYCDCQNYRFVLLFIPYKTMRFIYLYDKKLCVRERARREIMMRANLLKWMNQALLHHSYKKEELNEFIIRNDEREMTNINKNLHTHACTHTHIIDKCIYMYLWI